MEEIILLLMNSLRIKDLSLMILVCIMKLALLNPMKDHAKEDLMTSNVPEKTPVELAPPSNLTEDSALKSILSPMPPLLNTEKLEESMP